MTDVHCHLRGGDLNVRELVIGEQFIGIHPWDAREVTRGTEGDAREVTRGTEGSAREVTRGTMGATPEFARDTYGERPREPWLEELRMRLLEDPKFGVGEIGLDRLKDKNISPLMREVFESQLRLGIELNRPVVLHGAKCWGQIVERIRKAELGMRNDGVKFLFHGFSRSDGLIPDIAKLGGFISVGPAVLNDHAVNYRALVKKIPDECLVLETDRTEASAAECPTVSEICAKVAELRGKTVADIESLTDANARRFYAF